MPEALCQREGQASECEQRNLPPLLHFSSMTDGLFLMQEGAGANVVSAYVEIVFDNTDHRLDVSWDFVVWQGLLSRARGYSFGAVRGKAVTCRGCRNLAGSHTSGETELLLPVQNDKDEVVIKRQIGLKKDEYFIDSKHAT